MDSVFQAVADPTRRSILERLRDGGALSIQELARPLPMSRQAVTKHLDVLQDAGLVRTERAGRQRLHRLDAAPLKEVGTWLAPYAEAWDRRLARLKSYLDKSDPEGPAETEAGAQPEGGEDR